MDTLYTFLDNTTHYKTRSVHFLGLMNSATKMDRGLDSRDGGFPKGPKDPIIRYLGLG